MTRCPLHVRQSIIDLALAGRSKTEVRSRLKVKRRAVDRWFKEAQNQHPNIMDKPRSGRPTKFSSPDKKAIRRSARPGRTAAEIARSFTIKKNKSIHKSTVARILKRGRRPLAWLAVTTKRCLRRSNKLARAEFCKGDGPASRVSWVFLDSKMISLTKDKLGSLTFAWQDPKKRLKKVNKQLVAFFHFYAAVSKGHKSRLHFVPPSWNGTCPKSKETFKGKHFLDVMGKLSTEFKSWFKSTADFTVIRDRATQHVKEGNSQALAALDVPVLESFPAQSWDINCIEHVWAQLARRVRDRRPRTAAGLKKVILKEWEAISQSTINKLVAGVPKRMSKIAQLEGEWISEYID